MSRPRRDERTWHYIRPNETVRQPRHHIFLDTEARTDRASMTYTQTWRCGVAIFRKAPKGRRAHEEQRRYVDPDSLWKDVTQWTKPGVRTVLWTHNLAYDLRTSCALTVLPLLGWQLDSHNISSSASWLVWSREGATLVMTDSVSVFPTSLAQVAKSFMDAKEPLPDDADSDEAWWRRCERDVEILRNAIVAYLAWVEREQLGNWQMTGAGQAWAGYRHRFMTHSLLVHCDEDALEAERRAMWTGRCEAYWRGTTSLTRVDEWDLSAAYARIAQRFDVPTHLVGPISPQQALGRYLDEPGYAVLAEVDVDTAVPCVPTESGGRIIWPVGRFTTVLWDPEIDLLLNSGATVTVGRAWLYRAAPALAEWAEWVIGCLEAPDAAVPAWEKLILKSWSRTLIGRFGMTYRQWDPWATAGGKDCRQWTCHDKDTGETFTLIQVGDQVWRDRGRVEWDQSMPAITGWIMSACRAQLWHLLQRAGDRTALYVDTDSLLVTAEHYDLMCQVAAEAPAVGLRLKRSWDRVTILGPRQLVTGERVRVAGVPSRAEKMPDGSMRGEVWESLRKSIQARHPGQVVITPRTWRIKGVDHRRRPGPDGWTLPIHLDRSEPAAI